MIRILDKFSLALRDIFDPRPFDCSISPLKCIAERKVAEGSGEWSLGVQMRP